MSDFNDFEDSATVVITHRVGAANREAYEAWLAEIIPVCKSYPGHLGVMVIRPHSEEAMAYTIVVRFDTEAHLHTWTNSTDRRRLIEKVKPLLLDDDKFFVSSGLDFWFTPDHVKAKVPTRWKQWLVTWSAIYPLVVFMSQGVTIAMREFAIPDNFYLRMLLVTCLVVSAMVYVVMPRYTRLLHNWLFR